jgi:hypothetical protein
MKIDPSLSVICSSANLKYQILLSHEASYMPEDGIAECLRTKNKTKNPSLARAQKHQVRRDITTEKDERVFKHDGGEGGNRGRDIIEESLT